MNTKTSSYFLLLLVAGAAMLPLALLGCATSPVQAQNAPTVKLERVPDGGLQPQVVVRDGVVHLLYFKGDPKAGDLFYRRSNDDGATWQAPLRVNSEPSSAIAMGTIRGGQLAVGPKGRIFVVWNGSDKAPRSDAAPNAARRYGASPLLFARLNDAGNGFEPERNLLTTSWNLDGGADVAADEEGRVYVAWHANNRVSDEEGQRQVFLATSTDSGATFAPETPVWKEPTGACACCAVKLRVEKGGRLALLYRSATEMIHRDTYILNSSDGGRTFSGHKIAQWNVAMCPMSSFALTTDSAGQQMGAWENEAKVYFSTFDANANATKIQSAPGEEANAKYPTLCTSKGQTLLLWTQNSSWGRGGDAAWQLFDDQMRPTETAKGERVNVPAWSFATAFAGTNGGFTVLY